MKSSIDLIGRRSYRVGDIAIKIPTVAMIRSDNADKEKSFWREVSLFTKTPQDMISELYDSGIDFENITDYQLFLLLYSITRLDTKESLLFENIDFFGLELDDNSNLTDGKKTVINEEIYEKLSEVICAMIGGKKTEPVTFGNAFAKKMRIKQDRKKKEQARRATKETSGALGGIILRLVCNDNFPYNFETVNSVTIYELLHSLKQIDKDISVTELLQSGLAGNDLSKFPAERFNRYTL